MQDLAVVLQGARRIVEVLLERGAEAVLQIDVALLLVVDLDALAQDIGVIVPVLLREVELVERSEGLRVHRLVLEHLVVGDDGVRQIVDRADVEPNVRFE